MGAVLARDVHVTKDGVNFVVLPAGTAVPKEYAKLVTNPKAYTEEVEEPTEASSPTDPATLPYEKRNVKDLRDLLKGHELPTDGDKKALVARLLEFDTENAEESHEDEGTSDGDDSGDGGNDNTEE